MNDKDKQVLNFIVRYPNLSLEMLVFSFLRRTYSKDEILELCENEIKIQISENFTLDKKIQKRLEAMIY